MINDTVNNICTCDAVAIYRLKTNASSVYCASCFLRWMMSVTIMLSASRAMAVQENVQFHKQKQVLHEQVSDKNQYYETQIDILEQRIQRLEKVAGSGHRHKSESVAGLRGANEYQSKLKWSMSGIVAMGGSTASADELLLLQGGTHDPRKNGFTLQTLALAARVELGQYFDAMGSLVSVIEPDGESVVELEQAFIQSTNLPNNLSARVGQYFLDFGEENVRHPDDWDFVDVPFLITRFFGADKLRSQGMQLAWRPPLFWRSTLLLGVNNPNGETVTSFLYEEGEEVAGHVLQARDIKGLNDMLYMLKWSNQLPIDNLHRIGFGVSALFGPNATGNSTDTQIYGLDFEWTQYVNGLNQQPRFNWRTELMLRRYEAGDSNDPTHEHLRDYGIFSQAILRLGEKLTTGLRAEFADANRDNANDPLRDRRKRFSVNVRHSVSKSVSLRLQYNHDRADHLSGGSANSVWLQMVFKAGAHDEHK